MLELAAETIDAASVARGRTLIKVAGVCGKTDQAVREAGFARATGYDACLLSLAALKEADIPGLVAHCREVGQVMPLIGFYLQPSVGGRVLPYAFWRQFAEIPEVVAIKMAAEITDCYAAFFDTANGFAGCIPGIHEVLRRQGLLPGTWCLNPHEALSPGQREEIDRVYAAYPHLNDDAFVSEHLAAWLR